MDLLPRSQRACSVTEHADPPREVDAVSGPLQLIAMSFPSGRGPDRVLAEVDRVQARGGTRVLDMLLVAKIRRRVRAGVSR